MKDLTGYLETHYEVASAIESELLNHFDGKVHRLVERNGMGAKWELAKDITDKFEKIHEGREWDGDWLETLEDFILNELDNIKA